MKISKNLRPLLIAGLFLFSTALISCGGGDNKTVAENEVDTLTSTSTNNADANKRAQAVINATYSDTAVTGTASFTEENGKVKLELQLNIPARANGTAAVHIHETGDCGDTGMAAHGHWNPTNKQHGKWGEGEFHSGDIGNIQFDGSGHGTLTMETDLWSLGGDSTTNILNRAIIVHGGVDDFKTQPTGNAGNRIGCGVIQAM